MTRHALAGFGLGMMVWLGWLIPFHRLPLPEHYGASGLALALLTFLLGASFARLRNTPSTLVAAAAATALWSGSLGAFDAGHARWLGPIMLIAACASLVHSAFITHAATSTRVAAVLRDLAAGCVLAVAMLAIFLPLARLRMPILTVVSMLAIAWVARAIARPASR